MTVLGIYFWLFLSYKFRWNTTTKNMKRNLSSNYRYKHPSIKNYTLAIDCKNICYLIMIPVMRCNLNSETQEVQRHSLLAVSLFNQCFSLKFLTQEKSRPWRLIKAVKYVYDVYWAWFIGGCFMGPILFLLCLNAYKSRLSPIHWFYHFYSVNQALIYSD